MVVSLALKMVDCWDVEMVAHLDFWLADHWAESWVEAMVDHWALQKVAHLACT